MADVITSGASVIAPTIILGYESSRPGRTIIHPIVNRAADDATLRAAGPRTGRLELGFSGPAAEADSSVAEAVLATAGPFTFTSTDRTTVSLTFVVPKGGTITRTLEDTTRAAWVVAFDWHEVSP